MANNIISSLGAGSGIDIAKLVGQLTEAERMPNEQRLDARQAKLDAQISGYGKLKSAMGGLKDIIATLGNQDLFNARSVGVPSTEIITADKVNPGAQTGAYKIEVLEVASAQSLVMGSNPDRAAALNASGNMRISFGAWSYSESDGKPESFSVNDQRTALSIDIASTDSLDSIAAKINAEKGGVQASVLKVAGEFQLMLTSESGKSNAMEISVDDSSLNAFAFSTGGNPDNVTETQQASDARLKVNGLTVTRENNAIKDVIEGFEFTLNKASPGESLTYSINADKSTAEQAIRDFVEAYNSFQTTAKNLTGYSRDEDNNLVRGDLAGDSSARTMVSRMREMIGAAVPGVSSGFTALTNLGIRTERDGSISIKDEELSAAMKDNFDLVGKLFANNTTSTNTATTVNLGSYANKATAGNYSAEITQDPSRGWLESKSLASKDFEVPFNASGGVYDFKIKVDGIESESISLTGEYETVEDLRAGLQTLINGDANLKAGRVGVDVSYDNETTQFKFVSREYGSISKVSFSEVTSGMWNLGISAELTGTAGTDVAGTIDGVAGFGSGNVLLPDLDSKLYGLNLTVNPGAKDQGAFELNFSRGMAGEMTKLIDDLSGPSGAFKMRLDNIQTALDKISVDREALDSRMDKFNSRMLTQFMAMENIVNSLNSTGNQLDGLVDRLPFTARS